MGFSANLQGRSAHEALLSRQDAELRLLETMKRVLVSKVRSDREYAVALSSVANQGLKIDRSDELSGSLVATAWRSMMEELDNTGKLIKQNADAIESKALDALNVIYTEKRKARKLYQEEHTRIAQQFTHVSNFSALNLDYVCNCHKIKYQQCFAFLCFLLLFLIYKMKNLLRNRFAFNTLR